MEYLYELVSLINNFDGSVSAENRMRDLICYLSEEKEHQDDELYRTVIFEASEKLRVFGYIKGVNRIAIDEFKSNGVYDIKHQAIQNFYASKVFHNNVLDKKQKEIVDIFMGLDNKRLLVSAPTSFGKTFILREILFLNRERYKNMLLVFPTIALLNENTESMKDLISKLKSDYRIVNNVYSGIDENERHIFILTPERTLKLLSDNPELHIDFFFFDEVYKIDEDFSIDEDTLDKSRTDLKAHTEKVDSRNRAKAFRIALYLLSKQINEFYLAGPYLNLDNLKRGFMKFIHVCKVKPIQIEFEPTMRIEIEAWKKHSSQIHPILGKQDIEIFNKGSLLTTEKIVGITKFLSENDMGQAIFYCSTPANSMVYVRNIIDALPLNNDKFRINSTFITHLKQKYGVEVENTTGNTAEYWSLVKALESGYGVHHGKFPKYIQNQILKMFNNSDFDYLFCTSTIIEGVNTSAKNVVIINNSVGNATMSAFALKNIKGRAGRYYHHYIGRVFYTDPKQREIEHSLELQLDFPTYNSVTLLNVDLDSAAIEDLDEVNKYRKAKRDQRLNFELLPDEVFIKNRLFARDIQEKYLNFIMVQQEFKKYVSLIGNTNNIKLFLTNRMINIILESFELCEILEKNKAKVYHSVVSKYSIEGTRGIIKFHIDQHFNAEREKEKDPLLTLDRAYIRSFDQIRTIVEYEVPKLLCLFEALFIHAATLKGYDMSDFNMSSIIRFFELGITTEFGLSLVEYGFPVDTIRQLENRFTSLSTLSTIEAIAYLRQNNKEVVKLLDEYELGLFRLAIKSFEK